MGWLGVEGMRMRVARYAGAGRKGRLREHGWSAGIDINLIVVLDAILTERSLTRAGESIGLHPACGERRGGPSCAKLLDDPLLVRNGRTFDLTPRALALQPVVGEAIIEVGRTFNLRPMFDPRTSDRPG